MNDATRGLALGGVGVVIFALTLPMTRLAVGDVAAPQLPPAFETVGRAALAGVLSVVYLWAVRAPRPSRAQAPALAVCALGTVVGFPLGLALALRQVDAMHAAVVTGVLPLATALVGAVVLRQRASAGFWVCSVLGGALVVGFAAWADAPVQAAARAGFVYVSLFSMWLGFFAWYRGLALGGVLRVSQVQLLQPFVALLAAWALLGEALRPATPWFTLAVVGVVAVGRRMPVGAPRPRGDLR